MVVDPGVHSSHAYLLPSEDRTVTSPLIQEFNWSEIGIIMPFSSRLSSHALDKYAEARRTLTANRRVTLVAAR